MKLLIFGSTGSIGCPSVERSPISRLSGYEQNTEAENLTGGCR